MGNMGPQRRAPLYVLNHSSARPPRRISLDVPACLHALLADGGLLLRRPGRAVARTLISGHSFDARCGGARFFRPTGLWFKRGAEKNEAARPPVTRNVGVEPRCAAGRPRPLLVRPSADAPTPGATWNAGGRENGFLTVAVNTTARGSQPTKEEDGRRVAGLRRGGCCRAAWRSF